MARLVNKLSALRVARLTAPGFHGDGGGLWLQVSTTGSQSWVFRYAIAGRRHHMGLGAHALRAVGMECHEHVFGVRRSTVNIHLQIAASRVNPGTFNAVYPDRDSYKPGRAMRGLELCFNWSLDKCMRRLRTRWREHDRLEQRRTQCERRDAGSGCGHAHRASFLRTSGMILAIPSWRRRRMKDTGSRLHSVLAEHGLSLREKGQDLATFDTTGGAPTLIEVSDMHEDLSRAVGEAFGGRSSCRTGFPSPSPSTTSSRC